MTFATPLRALAAPLAPSRASAAPARVRRRASVASNAAEPDRAARRTDPDEGVEATTSSSYRPSRRGALLSASLASPGCAFLAGLGAPAAFPGSARAASPPPPSITSEVFFDFAVDAEPLGRVVVGVYGDASPISAARFEALARGVQGLGYKRTQVDAVEYDEDPSTGADTPIFVGDAGVRAFVIPGSSTPVVGLPGGPSAEALLPELARQTLSHDDRPRGLVSLVVERGAPPPPPKEKLVSINGKFVTVADPPAPGPNGTAFTVTVARGAGEVLDRTNVVVGEVLEGQEIVDAIAALPTVKDNSASPFFAVAKTIGDKRAVVAEQAFGKPFAKVTVARCGAVEKREASEPVQETPA